MSTSVPPTYYLRDLGPEAQAMSKNCKNERMAMILQCVAIGSRRGWRPTQLRRKGGQKETGIGPRPV